MVSSWNNSRELVSALLFLYLSGVRGAITSPPQNTATKVGSQTYLNCSGNNSVPAWKFGEQGMDVVLIELGSSCSVSSNYLSRYRGEGQGSNTCNLIVLNPSLQESGIYACQDLNLRPKYAVLTVLSSSGKPTVNNGSEVVEGDQLTITCAVEYSTASETLISVPIAPNLNWTTSGISIPNAVAVKTNVSVTSSLTVAATRAGIPTYDCTAQFLPPANKPDSAPNAPSNVYIGGTYPITGVYYPPTSVEINRTSLNQCIYSNKVFFTCHAASNPPAHYEWKDLTSDSNTSGQLIEVSHGGTYQCVATTTFRNKTYSANASTTVLGCEIPGNVTVKIIGRGECNNGVCDCGGHDSMEFECHASGIPPPYYKWRWISFGKSGSVNESKTKVYNGTYTCTVFNDFEGKTYNSSVVVNITGCCPKWKIIVSVIVPWVGECLIVTIIFIVCYASLANPFRTKMLSRFPWLDCMLPCMKKPKEPQRASENPDTIPVQSSENTCPPEKSKKNKRKRGGKTTENIDSSTKNPPHNVGIQSSTVPAGRPLPPKPGKLEPVKNASQTQTLRSQNFKTNTSEIKATVIGKDIAPRWKIFFFVVLLIVVSVTCGIVFFPILITIAYFSPKSKGDGQNVKSGAEKGKPAYLIPLIILMWFGVVVFMFPLTFVLVYFVHCEEMTFRYVVAP